MRVVWNALQILIAVLIIISLSESYINYDVAKRRLTFDEQVFPNGTKYYDNKSKEDIIQEKREFNNVVYERFSYKLIGDVSIFIVLIAFFFVNKKINHTIKLH